MWNISQNKNIDETSKRGQDAFDTPEMLYEKSMAKKITNITQRMREESSEDLEEEYNKTMEDAMSKMLKLKSLSASQVDKMMALVQQGQAPQ